MRGGGVPSRGRPSARMRVLAVLGVAAIAAVCSVLIKLGLAYAPPLLFAGLRTSLAGAALLAVAGARGLPLRVKRSRWPAVLLLALSGTTIGYAGMFLGPGRMGAGVTAVLANLQPLIALVLAALVLHERISRWKIVALGAGAAGISLIASSPSSGGLAPAGVGAVLALGASVGAAVASVAAKKMELRHELLPITAWQLVVGSVPLLIAGAAFERIASLVWSVPFVGILLFLALVGTALSTALWFWLLQHDEVGRLSLLLLAVPVLGLGLAAFVLGEQLTRVEGSGILLILCGVALALPARESPAGRVRS